MRRAASREGGAHPPGKENHYTGTGKDTPERSGGKASKSWQATMTKMQRELESLQSWKGDALNKIHSMQSNMEQASSKYKRQLQYNRQLQERLEELGRHAKEAIMQTP